MPTDDGVNPRPLNTLRAHRSQAQTVPHQCISDLDTPLGDAMFGGTRACDPLSQAQAGCEHGTEGGQEEVAEAAARAAPERVE